MSDPAYYLRGPASADLVRRTSSSIRASSRRSAAPISRGSSSLLAASDLRLLKVDIDMASLGS